MPDPTPTTGETGTPWHSLSSPYEALPLKLTLGCASTALAVLTVRQVAEQRQYSQRRGGDGNPAPCTACPGLGIPTQGARVR